MPGPNNIARGVSTRLKKRVRGFYTDLEPGFYGVKKGFGDAAKQKVASLGRARALRKIAAKYALLDESGEPIEALAKLFAESNFGYGDEPVTAKRTGDPLWGAPMGLPNEPGDRNGLSRNLSYGGV